MCSSTYWSFGERSICAAAIPTFRLLLRFLFLPHIGLTSTVPLDWRSAYTLMPIKVCGGRLRFVQHEMCICLCLYRSTELDTAAATSLLLPRYLNRDSHCSEISTTDGDSGEAGSFPARLGSLRNALLHLLKHGELF